MDLPPWCVVGRPDVSALGSAALNWICGKQEMRTNAEGVRVVVSTALVAEFVAYATTAVKSVRDGRPCCEIASNFDPTQN